MSEITKTYNYFGPQINFGAKLVHWVRNESKNKKNKKTSLGKKIMLWLGRMGHMLVYSMFV